MRASLHAKHSAMPPARRAGDVSTGRDEETVTGDDEGGTKTVTWNRKKGVHNNAKGAQGGERQGGDRTAFLVFRCSFQERANPPRRAFKCRRFVMPLNTASLPSLLRIRNILSIQRRRRRTMASSPSFNVVAACTRALWVYGHVV